MVAPHALPDLDAEEQRVLGALMEKQVTVPASYPLTLAALRTACNQTSSRDPVVDYDEPTVEAIVKRLREQELVRVVWAATGRRTLKYHQLLGERLGLADDERALLTVLLLRGPQPAGALRTPGGAAARLRRPRGGRGVPRGAGRPARNRWCGSCPAGPGRRTPAGSTSSGPSTRAGPPTRPPAGAGRASTGRACWPTDRTARDARVLAAYDAVAAAYADQLADEWERRPAAREVAARPRGRAGGGAPRRRGRLRTRSHHGVPRRRRRGRHGPRRVAGDGRAGPRAVPARSTTGSGTCAR